MAAGGAARYERPPAPGPAGDFLCARSGARRPALGAVRAQKRALGAGRAGPAGRAPLGSRGAHARAHRRATRVPPGRAHTRRQRARTRIGPAPAWRVPRAARGRRRSTGGATAGEQRRSCGAREPPELTRRKVALSGWRIESGGHHPGRHHAFATCCAIHVARRGRVKLQRCAFCQPARRPAAWLPGETAACAACELPRRPLPAPSSQPPPAATAAAALGPLRSAPLRSNLVRRQPARTKELEPAENNN